MADRRRTITFPIDGGMHSQGDAALIPEGRLRKVRNMLRRSGVWQKRHQFTYDDIQGRGLANWHDLDSGATRLVTGKYTEYFHAKAAASETWGSSRTIDQAWGSDVSFSLGGLADYGITDYTNIKGTLVFLAKDSSGTRTPIQFRDTEGNSYIYGGGNPSSITLRPYSLASYISRLFYGGATVTVDNVIDSLAYDASLAGWTKTNITAASVAGLGTLYRIVPTNTTTASIEPATAPVTVAATSGPQSAVWRADLRATSETTATLMTMQWRYAGVWEAGTTYAVGQIKIPTTRNALRYRVTAITTGTTHAVTEPTWPTTLNATVVDAGVTWTCDGADVLAESEITLPAAGSDGAWGSYTLRATIPAGYAASIAPLLKYGHDGAVFALNPVDIGYKDGRANGHRDKRNYGQQVTKGHYFYPFYNRDDTTAGTHDDSDVIFWSDVLDWNMFQSSQTYRLTEVPGPITFIRDVGGRLVVAKRNARWTFGAVDDPDIVILPEGGARRGAGILNPKAADIADDGMLYYVGENEVYRWDLSGEPEPLCGDAMRDEIMSKSTTSWVESQSAPANRALLAIDQKNREVWVYTQKGKLYVYDIDDEAWSVHDVAGGDSLTHVGKQICDMIYNPTTGKMYAAFTEADAGTAGLARLDESVAVAKDSISTSGTSTVYAEIWPRPIELSGPRFDITLENMRLHHKVTASQTDQTCTAYVSMDQGITFSLYNEVTIDPVSTGEYRPIEIPLYQTGGTLLPRIVHEGQGGATNFTISQIEADIQVMRGEYRRDHPTAVGSSL